MPRSYVPRITTIRRPAQPSLLPQAVRRAGEVDPYRGAEELLEESLIRAGLTAPQVSLLSPVLPAEEEALTQGQKQVQSLMRRLIESGHEVPEPEAVGREGVAGAILNALGAPSGAVTTLIYDLLSGQVQPLRSLARGFTGSDRKIGSDILELLGVENKTARALGGFVLDVLLDPTTYLGVGLVRNVGTEAVKQAARQALTRRGLKATEEELDTIIRQAIDPAARVSTTSDPRVAEVARAFGRPVTETPIRKGRKRVGVQYKLGEAQPVLPRQVELQVGIPFTSIQRRIADITPTIERSLTFLRSLPESTNPILRGMGRVGNTVVETTRRLLSPFSNLPPRVANLFRQRQMRVNAMLRRAYLLGAEINKALGGGYNVNPALHEAIAKSIDNPKLKDRLISALPPDQQKLALDMIARVEKIFDEIEEAEVRAGILSPDQVRAFYFTHLLAGPERAVKAAREAIMGTQPYTVRTTGPHQMTRRAETFADLERFVQQFNTDHPELPDIRVNYDVGQVVATRAVSSEVLLANKALIDNIINLGPDIAIPVKPGERLTNPNYVRVTGVNPDLDNYALHEDVARFIREWDRLVKSEFDDFINFLDRVNGLWQGLVTISPGFHVRNLIGAIFNNWLMGVRNPVRYGDAFELITLGRARSANPNMEVLRRKRFTLANGTTLDGAQVVQLADQFGVLNAGWAGTYIPRRIEQLGQRKLQDFNPLELSRRFGEYIEDTARLAGFIDQLVKTGDPYQAALQVKKYQFDYSELSSFERQVLRRVIPFYTWMRKNIPLQLEHLIRTPGVYTSLVHAVDEGASYADVDPELMPEYLASQIAIPLHRSAEGIVTLLSPFALPAADALEAAQAFSNPAEFGRFIGQSLFPWIRVPLEVAANRQFYSGVPIDVEAEQTGTLPSVPSVLNYLFTQTGLPYNLYRSITGQRELIPTREPREEHEFTTRSPAPFTPMGAIGLFQQYNPEYYLTEVFPYQYQGQLRREIRELTRRGETVYTTQELDQAKALGLHPEQVRIIHQLLEQYGMRKTKENVRDMYIRMQLQQGQ